MVVLRSSTTVRTRRAASVPVGYLGDRDVPTSDFLEATIDSQNAAARRISNAAKDDTDALRLASKRHDQQLLRDINTRLANAPFNKQPPVVYKKSTSYVSNNKKPPLPPVGRSVVYSATSAAPRYGAGSKELLLLKAPYYVDDGPDLDYVIPATPVTSSIIRSSRSTSVPPQLPSLTPRTTVTPPPSQRSYRYWTTNSTKRTPSPSTVDGLISTRTYVSPGYSSKPEYDYVQFSVEPSTTRSTVTSSLTPVADLAIRQAHRNLDRIDKELKYSKFEEPRQSTSYIAKTIINDVDQGPVVAPVIRRTVYATTPYVRHTSLSPVRTPARSGYVRTYRRNYVTSPSPVRSTDITFLASPPSEPQIKASTAAKLAALDIEAELFPTEFYNTRIEPPIVTKKTVTYSPLPSVVLPVTPSVDVSNYAVKTTTSIKSATPLPAAVPVVVPPLRSSLDLAPIPQPGPVRPKVSETRKKVREVLCRVKKDPHYFD